MKKRKLATKKTRLCIFCRIFVPWNCFGKNAPNGQGILVKKMKGARYIKIICLLCLLAKVFVSYSQTEFSHQIEKQISRNQRVPAYIDIAGDTIPTILLRPYVKYGNDGNMSAKQERYYWKLVRDVRKCLPLAKLAASTMIETTEYIRTLPTQEEREKHLRKMEKDLVKEYEPVLRKMTYSQGKVLLKLIVRECNSTPYEILQAYLGNFAADFWQAIARLFTADLKMDYNPDGKDALIEKIATKIEQGEL